MNLPGRKKIVLLGMMSNMPVAGVVWQYVHYLVGFQRLGYDVYYVEAHARTPSMFMEAEEDDGALRAANFISQVMAEIGLPNRWSYHALHDDGQCYGLSEHALRGLYASAELIINLHGGTMPQPVHSATGRLVFVETDPVTLQIELHDNVQPSIDLLEQHCALFTFGENLGAPDCKLPVSDEFHFRPTRQPVVLDFWSDGSPPPSAEYFTTIGNWQQQWRSAKFQGETYHWSKHLEFLKFLDLPLRTSQKFELALSSYDDATKALLEENGWSVRHALDFSRDTAVYRDYITASRGEFTVAKDQNVRLRSGWFSDRSATYLAAGRPVINQDTGFPNLFPTGEGLFAFSDMEEILTAIDAINSDYVRHSRAAYEIASEYFDYRRVLGRLVEEAGAARSQSGANGISDRKKRGRRLPFPASLAITPISRRPLLLPDQTVSSVLSSLLPPPAIGHNPDFPRISIVIVTANRLVFTKLCLGSLFGNTDYPNYEVIVVDNNSDESTRDYLTTASRTYDNLRVVFNDTNVGFAVANNQGVELADGEIVVLLNNDTIVSRDWLSRIAWHLNDPGVGAVGPSTNRSGTGAEIDVFYHTYGELMDFMEANARLREGETFDASMLAMFCFALKRQTLEATGPLDDRFELGTFEDDDYSMRLRTRGLVLRCARDVFIHHFGQATFGALVPTGEYETVFQANRKRFEEKWQIEWQPHERAEKPQYSALVERIRELVTRVVPPNRTLAVISKGDEQLTSLPTHRAWHFPQNSAGAYAGFYPSDSAQAIAELELLRERGAEFLLIPATSAWWLQHYQELGEYLRRNDQLIVEDKETATIFALS